MKLVAIAGGCTVEEAPYSALEFDASKSNATPPSRLCEVSTITTKARPQRVRIAPAELLAVKKAELDPRKPVMFGSPAAM